MTKTNKLAYCIGLFMTLYTCINIAGADPKILTCSVIDEENSDKLNKLLKTYDKDADQVNKLTWKYKGNTAIFITLGDIAGTSTLENAGYPLKYIETKVDYFRNHRNLFKSGKVDLRDVWTVYKLGKGPDFSWKLNISVSPNNCKVKAKHLELPLDCAEVTPSELGLLQIEKSAQKANSEMSLAEFQDFLKCDDSDDDSSTVRPTPKQEGKKDL